MVDEVAGVALAAGAARAVRRGASMLLVTPAAGEQVSVPVVQAAVDAANRSVDSAVFTGGGAAAGNGGVVVVVCWDEEDLAAITTWLTAVAVALSEAGVRGVVRPVPERSYDNNKIFGSFNRPVVPTLLAAYHVTSDPTPGPLLTKRIDIPAGPAARLAARLASWGAELGDQPRYLSVRTTFTRLDELDLTEWLHAAIRLADGFLRLEYINPKQLTLRGVRIHQPGQLVVQEAGNPSRPWPELVDQARQLLLHDPAALDTGHIRNAIAEGTGDWADLQYLDTSPGHLPPYPGVTGLRYLGNGRPRHSRVLDAAAIQILTGQHLANATNLDRWNITEVAADRYLVEAPDLAPWFAQDAPDSDTLQQARQDFGDMIITEAEMDATNPPFGR